MKHIAMLSGGRDSTAMVFCMLDAGMPLDYVIFTDTGAEFPEMYEYLNRVDQRLANYGLSITNLRHRRDETFGDWCFGRIKSGARKGMVRGVPMVTQPCYWKRESKVRPFERFLTEQNIHEYAQYIGYTYSEKKRSKVKDPNQRFPLIGLKMCEADVDAKLQAINLVNPLYKNFERTGCYFCPYQKVRNFYVLWKLHPVLWSRMRGIERHLDRLPNVLNPQWNIRYSIAELEHAFENGIILHEVEAPAACGCDK